MPDPVELRALPLDALLKRIKRDFADLDATGQRWGRDAEGEVAAADAQLVEAERQLAAIKADLEAIPQRRAEAIRAGDIQGAMGVQKRFDDAPIERAMAELVVIDCQIRHREALAAESGEIARAGRAASLDLGDCMAELQRRRAVTLRPIDTARSMVGAADIGELRARRQQLLEQVAPLGPVVRNLTGARR